MSPDKYLNALVTNDLKVIKKIYHDNYGKVFSFILKNRGHKEDVDDIFQKGLLQLAVRYKKAPFTINTSFEAYFFTVCKNLWRRELNKKKRMVTNSKVVELVDDNTDIAMATLEQERWELFNEYLEKLSDNCKQVLKLFFKKVGYAHIVEQFGYNTETVARQRVFKCKKKLKELISQDHRFKSLTHL
jgi:RNA polymerase sigma factor (sigma-70 family)